MFTGSIIIGLDVARNILTGSGWGLVDMLLTFVAVVFALYGWKALKFFLPPAAYILALLAAYHVELSFSQVIALELWVTNLMAGLLAAIGIKAQTVGNIVAIYGAEVYALEVTGACTGIKGVAAYGSLAALKGTDLPSSLASKIAVLGMGFGGTFLINLLRLSAIFLSSYYLGVQTGLVIHTYLGYSLFLVWVFIFWELVSRYSARKV